jgi:hypothetical protein
MPGPLPLSPPDEEPELPPAPVEMVGVIPRRHPPWGRPRAPLRVAPVRRLGGRRPQLLGAAVPHPRQAVDSGSDSDSDGEDIICPPRVGDVDLEALDVAALHVAAGESVD